VELIRVSIRSVGVTSRRSPLPPRLALFKNGRRHTGVIRMRREESRMGGTGAVVVWKR